MQFSLKKHYTLLMKKIIINSNNIFLKILSKIMMINCVISYKL